MSNDQKQTKTIGIRPVHGSDIPQLLDICLKTGNHGGDATGLYSDSSLLGQRYALPYGIYSPEYCFVATDKEIPVGYILGAPDSNAFNTWLAEDWLPLLRKKYPLDSPTTSENERRFLESLHSEKMLGIIPEGPYPAHLHINFLEPYQGQGIGGRLMDALKNKCVETGIPGIHLHMNPNQQHAFSFYVKQGFHVVERTSDWAMMARIFEPEAGSSPHN